MEQWLHSQETKILTQSSIPVSGVALGMLAHSRVPIHNAPEGPGDARPQQHSFPSWVHQWDSEPSYTEALPFLPDKMAQGHCIAFFSTTLQRQVSGSNDPISMRLVVIEDLGTGLCR